MSRELAKGSEPVHDSKRSGDQREQQNALHAIISRNLLLGVSVDRDSVLRGPDQISWKGNLVSA